MKLICRKVNTKEASQKTECACTYRREQKLQQNLSKQKEDTQLQNHKIAEIKVQFLYEIKMERSSPRVLKVR